MPEDAYRANLRALVELVAAWPSRLVWVRSTPCDERIHNVAGMRFHRFTADLDRYNGVADEVMVAAGVPLLDLHAFTRNVPGDLYCDHVHFREHVREKQAAFIAGWLWAAGLVPVGPVR